MIHSRLQISINIKSKHGSIKVISAARFSYIIVNLKVDSK